MIMTILSIYIYIYSIFHSEMEKKKTKKWREKPKMDILYVAESEVYIHIYRE